MLDLLSFRNSKGVKHIDQTLGTKQSHQIVFQGNVELRLTGISLTSGTSAELIVDTS